jgi:putative membrane protein
VPIATGLHSPLVSLEDSRWIFEEQGPGVNTLRAKKGAVMAKHPGYMLVVTIAATCTFAAASAWGVDDQVHGTRDRDDSSFAEAAASGGLLEVRLGQYATHHASDESVKRFGQQMVDDHEKANIELKEIANRSAIPLPDTLNEKDQRTYDRLSRMTGPEFDRQYMKAMVEDHQNDVNAFEREARDSLTMGKTDVDLWAAKTLPTLKHHLEEARQVAHQVGVNPPEPTSR